jgi:cell division protein FtsI (penicillin-binding protein 3)
MPGESRGLVHRLEHWTPSSIGAVSMGQEVGVTPVQLIAAVSAIANGGTLYKPHVVSELRRGDVVLPVQGILASGEPKTVIRQQTAATLRRLMEGVVLKGGTGTLARLDGWTAAGKTGSAQKIDPDTGRYSATQLIASFTGFAPINNPAVTILVSLDSPVGQHEGGQVAAPVFKRVAEQVLAYLDVPRDVPVNARLMQASYKQNEADTDSLEDLSVADFSAQPEELLPEASATGNAAPARTSASLKSGKTTEVAAAAPPPSVTVSVDEGGDIMVPDFSGRTMRDVTDECLRLGLNPVLVGSSLATGQSPAGGSKVKHGAKVTVEFGTPDAKAGKLGRTRN